MKHKTKLNYKKIFDAKILTLIAGLLIVISTNESFASQSERTVEIGENTLIYRDISNISPTPEPEVSTDKFRYSIGETVILTINDFNANLDTTLSEQIVAIVSFSSNSINVDLFETDTNTGAFVGTFGFQGPFSISYMPDPAESARVSINLDVDSGGNVVLGDVIIADEDIPNMCFYPVSHAFEVTSNGAVLGDGSTITMSYANVIYPFEEDPLFLQMYYKTPDAGWQIISPNFFVLDGLGDISSFNFVDKTITNNPVAAATVANGYSGPIGEGQYILGIETSCGGGGGGGLIRPGLVLNLLAGLPGGAGIDRSPPSLNFAKPPDSQDGFGGILITEDNTNSFPLVINGNGYYLPAFSTTIDPVELNTGQDVDLTLTFLESTGVDHVALHIVDESSDDLSDADAIIIFDKGTVTKSDPNGILADDITFSQSKEGNKYSFNLGFSFDQPGKRHLMIKAWDSNKNSGNTKVFDAFAVSGEPVPDDGIGHMIYLDLGAFFITPNGIWSVGEKVTTAQPVIEYQYPDSVGRVERHDSIIYDNIENEKIKANQVASEKFDLETQTFVEEKKQLDTRRAPELSLTTVGHKIRDFTLSPEENKELIKELAWIEHLKAQKILDLMFVSSIEINLKD
jgi:hypothetical protein